jgi:nucleolar protein 15
MSTAFKKISKISKTKSKQSLAEVDTTPAASSGEHKLKLAKAEDHVRKTKSKLVRGEGIKRVEQPRVTTAEETRRDTVKDLRKHANRPTLLAQKSRGPWKAPSPSPSLSPTPEFEPSHLEDDEPEAPQEEDSPGEEDVHLYGFSTDEDSSDDDMGVDEGAVLDVGSLPTVARDDATVKRRLEKAKRKPVRLSHLLHHTCNTSIVHSDRSAGVRNGCSLSWPDSTWLL